MTESWIEDGEKFIAELNILCQQRAEIYPVRGEVHAELSEKMDEFALWLQETLSDSWQPDPDRVKQAESLSPLLVGGFFKSGTTFVLNLLDGHPALSALPGDSKLMRAADRMNGLSLDEQAQTILERWIHSLINPTGLPPFWLFTKSTEPYREFVGYLNHWLGDSSLRHLLESVPRAYFAANPSRSADARFWVDKTPTQERNLDRWLELYPDACFIHVIRNPLAVLAAMKTMAESHDQPFPMARTIGQLRESMRRGLYYQKDLGEHRYIILRYEDILDDPAAEMGRIADLLRIPYDDSLITPTINGMPSTPNSAYADNRLQGQIQKRSAEKWRERLTPHEIALITTILADEASAYRYEWEDITPQGFRQLCMKFIYQITISITYPFSRFTSRIKQTLNHRLS